jgi:hypothetical protein
MAAAAVDFEVPDKLREYGIKRIAQIGSVLKVEYHDKTIATTFNIEKISTSIERFRKQAARYIISNGKAAEDIIEDVATQITKEALRVHEEKLKNGGSSDTRALETSATVIADLELTEDLKREVSWQEIASILSTSIKKDEAPKLITFCAMLLAQTNEDQLNIGYQSESSAGKSYIPIEVSSYFPKNEVQILASASPTAFYHDSGKWDAERKVVIKDLEHKNLIFLDQPHFQLLERLRPMLSHDMKELHYKITDKDQKKGLRTKDVIIKGYPSVFFCTTKTDPDEQEKTRMLLLSPQTDQEKLRESLALASLRKGNPEEYRKHIEEDPQRTWLMNRIWWVRQWGIREIVILDNGKVVYDRFMKEHRYLIPRHQRDFPRIFSFIKAYALLNCFNREKIEEDTIIATQADIDAGFALYKEIELSNELGLSPYIFRIYTDVIAPLLDYDGVGNGVTREDIIKKHYEVRHKMLSPETLRKDILPQLEVVGLIRQEKDQETKKMLVYPTVSTTTTILRSGGSSGGGEDSGVKSENCQGLDSYYNNTEEEDDEPDDSSNDNDDEELGEESYE